MIVNENGKPYFYKITNKLNGKYYYGSGQFDKYTGSGFALKRAQKKYGLDAFNYEVLRYFENREDAYRFEHIFLTLYKLDKDPKSYNCVRNAAGGYISDEQYEKNREITRAFRATKEGSVRGSDNPRYNHTRYTWERMDTGEIKVATQHEMMELIYGPKRSNKAAYFGYVARGARKSHKRWKLVNNC